MIGWERIVVTVGEKIGKTHLTYAQGAAAEIVAVGTIGLADLGGLPVSATHVLSSGVAGTMAASGSRLQPKTVRAIMLAWVLALPAAMALAASLYALLRPLLASPVASSISAG
jgi:PiT family inorganic phosphate transporter